MITYKHGWRTQLTQYAIKYGQYQAFLSSFDENAINRALFDASNHFKDDWIQEFIAIAMDPFDSRKVTVEQGTHQTENLNGGGFCLHFTGRDWYNTAYHFYVKQRKTGEAYIFEVSYSYRGQIYSVKRI